MSQTQQQEKGSDPVNTNEVSIEKCQEQSYQNELVCQNCWKKGQINSEVPILCFKCKKYLCGECDKSYLGDHKDHRNAVYNRNESDETQQMQIDNIRRLLEEEDTEDFESAFLDGDYEFSELPINVKTVDEKCRCLITGIAKLPYGLLALVDNKNHSMKVIELNEMKFEIFKFTEAPFDVAFFTKNNVAVTFPDKAVVLIVDINSDQPVNATNVPINDPCTGIDSFNEEVYAISNTSMYIIQKDGRIKSMIYLDLHQIDLKVCDECYIALKSADDIFIAGNKCRLIYRTAIHGDQINLRTSFDTKLMHISGLCIINESTILLSNKDGILKLVFNSDNVGDVNTTPILEVSRPQALAESRGIVFVNHKAGSKQRNFVTTFEFCNNQG